MISLSLFRPKELPGFFKKLNGLKEFRLLPHPLFFYKIRNWEHWDFSIVYALTGVLHLWQSMKARSFFYFSSANPGLENSGFIGERKSEIMKLIPDQMQPKWFLVENLNFTEIQNLILLNNLTYPLIAKPNIGERGKGVARIDSEIELLSYFQKISVPFLIQGFVNHEFEAGIFYYRYPDEKTGVISSLVLKEFLHVMGDGKSTLSELVDAKPRARLVKGYLAKKFETNWKSIIPMGLKLKLEGIGNHCRGTTFLNGNEFISQTMVEKVDAIAKDIPGFYFGRFDVRAKDVEALENGDFQILELNGAGAEPAHIYHPGFSFWNGQKVLLHHWKVLFKISRLNHKNGIPIWSFSKARTIRRLHKEAIKSIGI